mmetsp:Transcript_45219/g.144087  ORF Transcript_45219/g.144087 Transcript_45219/m.144087 type:complete len:216 (-) Transcript_45219:529-1176(-)
MRKSTLFTTLTTTIAKQRAQTLRSNQEAQLTGCAVVPITASGSESASGSDSASSAQGDVSRTATSVLQGPTSNPLPEAAANRSSCCCKRQWIPCMTSSGTLRLCSMSFLRTQERDCCPCPTGIADTPWQTLRLRRCWAGMSKAFSPAANSTKTTPKPPPKGRSTRGSGTVCGSAASCSSFCLLLRSMWLISHSVSRGKTNNKPQSRPQGGGTHQL